MSADMLLPEGENYAPWLIEVLEEPHKLQTEELYRHLVGWAILAANSHNVQPWRFILRPKGRSIDVCIDPEGILPASDPKGREAHVSIGCAVENLVLAAEYFGLLPHVEYVGERYPLPSVKIHFGDLGDIQQDSKMLLDAMKIRMMNRGQFDPRRPVPEDFLTSARAYAHDLNVPFDVIGDAPTRFAIAELQYTADRAVIARGDFRRELAQFLLPNDTSAGRAMPGNTFGLSDEMALYVHEELKGEGKFDSDLAAGFAITGRDGIKSSPSLGVISIKSDEPEWWIKSGQVFQRTALLATVCGVSIAMHAALVEVGVFNKLLKVRLRRLRMRPTVVFRMGYTKEIRPHSPRLPVDDVVEVEE